MTLPQPLPIHIEYFTASIDPETGHLVQREDIYGYARAMTAALGGETRPAQVAERKPKRVVERAGTMTAKTATAKTATAKTAVATDEDPR